MYVTQFLKNLRGTNYVQLINFQDPILKRVIYQTLAIFNIPQKLAKNQYVYGGSFRILVSSQILVSLF